MPSPHKIWTNRSGHPRLHCRKKKYEDGYPGKAQAKRSPDFVYRRSLSFSKTWRWMQRQRPLLLTNILLCYTPRFWLEGSWMIGSLFAQYYINKTVNFTGFMLDHPSYRDNQGCDWALYRLEISWSHQAHWCAFSFRSPNCRIKSGTAIQTTWSDIFTKSQTHVKFEKFRTLLNVV